MTDQQEMDEKEFVLLAKQGDHNAFESLVYLNANYVFNLAFRLTNNHQEAEDLSQEAFIRMWKALPNFRADSRFRTWLYRIVTNLCYDRLPKLRQELASIEFDDVIDLHIPTEGHPEKSLLSQEIQTELHKVIDHLPQSYRLLITLRHLQALSYNEISEVTGQPLGTVKAGISRARKLLRERMTQYESQSG
ncbi:MAG: sigma-70 family RNA polymerase sigma factor [Anaerolineaceae bacterium]|nr:sigma-70 family RNA polymerase sigma factor [Anaerolineaceae bacterium]